VCLTLWFENGQKNEERNYIDGKKNGKFTLWFENGQKKSEANYKDEQLNGKTTLWHENGQMSTEVNYIDGKEDGKWTRWNKKGQMAEEKNYKDGDLIIRTFYNYHANGQIKMRENYKDGKKDGMQTTWHENGQIRSEINYKAGDLVTKPKKVGKSGVDPEREKIMQLEIRERQQQERLKYDVKPVYIQLILSKINRIVQRISVLRLGMRTGYWEGMNIEASSQGSFVDIDMYFVNIYDMVNYLPRALQVGFLSPFPASNHFSGNGDKNPTCKALGK
jgi:antitoxin component YwqK of YwqJK toxin-antitoxin module